MYLEQPLLLLSVFQFQPQQLHRPGIPTHVMVGVFYRKGNHDWFSLQMNSSDTVANLKLQIEKNTGIAQNRLLLRGCYYRGGGTRKLHPNNKEELEALGELSW